VFAGGALDPPRWVVLLIWAAAWAVLLIVDHRAERHRKRRA
jgi:hypothetical protein